MVLEKNIRNKKILVECVKSRLYIVFVRTNRSRSKNQIKYQ